jgi:chaperonin GroES
VSEKTKGTKFRPLADQVVVRWLDAGTTTAGGIHLPDSAKEDSRLATVLAVGPGLRLSDGGRADMEVMVGDRVLVSSHTRTLSEVYETGSGKKKTGVAILREHEILAVVEEP